MINHLDGVCHVPTSTTRRSGDGGAHRRQREDASLRPATRETLLVAEGIARKVLPAARRIFQSKEGGRARRRRAQKLIPGIKKATEETTHGMARAGGVDPLVKGPRRAS